MDELEIPIKKTSVPYKILPEIPDGPIGHYYSDIVWGGEYDNWEIVRIFTPPDGSCFFHAICNSFFTPYHTCVLQGKRMSREKMISSFRKELADKLSSKIQGGKTYYESLNNGNMKEFSKGVPEFTLENMQKELASNNPLGYGYVEFISDVINKDIYILDADRRDIYVSDEVTTKGNRNSIVIYYSEGHYELVGIKSEDSFIVHFSPEHSFIKFLYDKVYLSKNLEE